MISALAMIPRAAQASRIVRGVRVEHVCGDPNLSPDSDRELSERIVRAAMQALQTEVSTPTIFEPSQPSPREASHAS